MVERLPNLSELSASDKDDLIVRLFADLTALQAVVEDSQARMTLTEAENQELRAESQRLRSENKDLRGKLVGR